MRETVWALALRIESGRARPPAHADDTNLRFVIM
jgi:hypothetical protein